jgi:hypothetical protein
MNHTNTTHFKVNLIKADEAIQYHLTSSLVLLLFYLCFIVSYDVRISSQAGQASHTICVTGWLVWLITTIIFFCLTLDIDFSQGIDNKTNQFEAVNIGLILVELTIFIMNLVWQKIESVKRVTFQRYEVVNEQEVENFNKF